MNARITVATLLVTTITLLSATNAFADVTYAKRGWFWATVKVQGKDPNTTYDLEVSTTPGGTTFVSTGHTITTDANGNGTERVGNIESGNIRKGHVVRVGTNTRTVPAKVIRDKVSQNSQGSVEQPLRLQQTVIDEDNNLIDLIETWEPGAIYTLQLDNTEASFVDLGASVTTEGDLVATLLSVTAQQVSVQIVSDPSPDSPNDIVINGVGIATMPGVTELHPQLALTGTQVILIAGDLPFTHTNDGSSFVDQVPIAVETAYIRGDCNVDSFFDIADAVKVLNNLFPTTGLSTAPSPCDASCDANGDNALNIGDAVAMLQALFGTNAGPLPGPFPNCGPAPSSSDATLTCSDYTGC